MRETSIYNEMKIRKKEKMGMKHQQFCCCARNLSYSAYRRIEKAANILVNRVGRGES